MALTSEQPEPQETVPLSSPETVSYKDKKHYIAYFYCRCFLVWKETSARNYTLVKNM